MEPDSWTRLSAASKRHQSALQSRYDLYLGFEEVDGGDEEPHERREESGRKRIGKEKRISWKVRIQRE
ncbi:uncharacterized protein A4U43_C05F21810 [Asparagus officinalis]|uniref:Uncharacterized protein n=1 Tax=Asparagus officinalis TaxID=4686 RepID=A0A5P1EXJ6_ASPOF|nr:uncharacterized protein A4U43_C05F21810 [Asparagus officinalis]